MKHVGPAFCGILGVLAIILAIGMAYMEDRNNQLQEKYEHHLSLYHDCTHLTYLQD